MRKPRFSRKIENIKYDPDSKILKVYFNYNCSKTYLDVPQSVFEKFSGAADKNEFYSEKIDGNYTLQ